MNSLEPLMTLFSALYIMGSWILVWAMFLNGDSRALEIRAGANKSGGGYASHPKLMVHTTLLIVCMFLFYAVSFNSITSITLPVPPGTESLLGLYLKVAAFILVTIGTCLLIGSRKALAHMTAKEVMFALNTDDAAHVMTGLYKYADHPMYLGMICVLSGSFLLFPTMLGLAFALIICLAILAKIKIETR